MVARVGEQVGLQGGDFERTPVPSVHPNDYFFTPVDTGTHIRRGLEKYFVFRLVGGRHR